MVVLGSTAAESCKFLLLGNFRGKQFYVGTPIFLRKSISVVGAVCNAF